MGEDKLNLTYHGTPLLQCALDLLEELPVQEKILVTTKARLDMILLPPGVRAVINTCPESGQSGSVRLGLEAASGSSYLFLTADQPRLSAYDLHALIDAANRNSNSIIYPVIGGKPCSPTLFPALFREELLALTGDVGGKMVRDAHPEKCIEVEPEFPGNFHDIDNAEDYQAFYSYDVKL